MMELWVGRTKARRTRDGREKHDRHECAHYHQIWLGNEKLKIDPHETAREHVPYLEDCILFAYGSYIASREHLARARFIRGWSWRPCRCIMLQLLNLPQVGVSQLEQLMRQLLEFMHLENAPSNAVILKTKLKVGTNNASTEKLHVSQTKQRPLPCAPPSLRHIQATPTALPASSWLRHDLHCLGESPT